MWQLSSCGSVVRFDDEVTSGRERQNGRRAARHDFFRSAGEVPWYATAPRAHQRLLEALGASFGQDGGGSEARVWRVSSFVSMAGKLSQRVGPTRDPKGDQARSDAVLRVRASSGCSVAVVWKQSCVEGGFLLRAEQLRRGWCYDAGYLGLGRAFPFAKIDPRVCSRGNVRKVWQPISRASPPTILLRLNQRQKMLERVRILRAEGRLKRGSTVAQRSVASSSVLVGRLPNEQIEPLSNPPPSPTPSAMRHTKAQYISISRRPRNCHSFAKRESAVADSPR